MMYYKVLTKNEMLRFYDGLYEGTQCDKGNFIGLFMGQMNPKGLYILV